MSRASEASEMTAMRDEMARLKGKVALLESGAGGRPSSASSFSAPRSSGASVGSRPNSVCLEAKQGGVQVGKPRSSTLERQMTTSRLAFRRAIRHYIEFKRDRAFDVKQLPIDMQRVYHHLKTDNGEEYALKIVFTMRTAVELHRAWHMTLLTSKILQQLKDKYKLRMTWNLGVVKLKFRIDDGLKEVHRRVPYDYE